MAEGAKARVIILSTLSGIVLEKRYIRTELLLLLLLLFNLPYLKSSFQKPVKSTFDEN